MRLRAIGLLLALGGCSTLAPKVEPSNCSTTAECADEPGTVCQFGFCLPAMDTPPQVYVGFDLRERTQPLRVEVAGCDVEAELGQSTGVRAIEVPRSQLTMLLDLRVFRTDPGPDLDDPPPELMLDSTLVLSQRSRFAFDDLRLEAEAPTLEGEDTVVPTTFPWPRYHPLDAASGLPEHTGPLGHILWRIVPEPTEGQPIPPAWRYLNITPPIAAGLPDELPGSELNPLQTCVVDDKECCPPTEPMCETEEVENACVPAGIGVDGLTSGVCRRQAFPLYTFDHVYEGASDRAVSARVRRVDPDTLADLGGLAGATVNVSHADTGANRVGLPALGVLPPEDRPSQCGRDDACVEDLQFCNPQTRQCEANLGGLRAATGTTTEETDAPPGEFNTRVFTYAVGSSPAVRTYAVRVEPPADSGLPPVDYEVSVDFQPIVVGDPEAVDLGGDKALCVPDWGPPSTILVEPVGLPRMLLSSNGEDYSCCNLDCLPTDQATPAPKPPASCSGTGSGASAPAITASTALSIDPAATELYLAADSPCVLPATDDKGVAGVLRRPADCGGDPDNPGVCSLDGMPGAPGQERMYTVRIEPPTGSVLGSVDAPLPIGSEPLAEPVRIALPPRRIVRGRVTLSSGVCDPDEEDDNDCGSEGARVLAERLRVAPETEANTPGPYFHEVSTFTDPMTGDGAYVLPLDPGYWVMTALPDPGTAGGPALYTVVELTDAADEEWEENFTLEQGILVTIDINSFDRRSQVLPLDIGSWRFQTDLQHPDRAGELELEDRLLDLMAPGECLVAATETLSGCRIRRLVSGSSLSLTQVGQVRFTARDLGKNAAFVCTTPP